MRAWTVPCMQRYVPQHLAHRPRYGGCGLSGHAGLIKTLSIIQNGLTVYCARKDNLVRVPTDEYI